MTPYSINLRGRLVNIDRPLVMAILNVTSDSFFAGSRVTDSDNAIADRVAELIAQGADMIDIGACSTRPGSTPVDAADELARVRHAIAIARDVAGADIPISVDTYRASVAADAISAGADIINDISCGHFDPDMLPATVDLGVPYILSHMPARSADTMHTVPDYPDGVTRHLIASLSDTIAHLRSAGLADIIIDPGFGFGKTVADNYQLLHDLPVIEQTFKLPILAGISRKSMITRPLAITPDQALCPTTALNMALLQAGAAILRVHDPLPAAQTITLYSLLNKPSEASNQQPFKTSEKP